MKIFVVVSALLVVARAGVIAPIALQAVPSSAIVAAVPVGHHSSQYHSQDAIGQYAYGYANELSSKNEIKSADGQTVGSYSYVDAEGKLQNVQYRSDALHGFRVSATNLPVGPSPIDVPALAVPEPVRDTPEVIEARSRHLEALRHAESEAKTSSDSIAVEVKSTVAHPAIISSASPAAVIRAAPAAVELVRAAPIVAAPSFGYSFGINYGGLYSVNSYSVHPQPFVTAYASPGHLISAPIVAEASPFVTHLQEAIPEAPKDLPEVIDARAKHLEAVKSIREDIEKEQLAQAKE